MFIKGDASFVPPSQGHEGVALAKTGEGQVAGVGLLRLRGVLIALDAWPVVFENFFRRAQEPFGISLRLVQLPPGLAKGREIRAPVGLGVGHLLFDQLDPRVVFPEG